MTVVVDATNLRAKTLPAPELAPPISKSDAQRALALFPDVPLPDDEELPDDVRVVRDGLFLLQSSPSTIDCRDGGLSFRLLVGQAAVTPGARVTFSGSRRLGQRPHEPLLASLERALGAVIERGDPWPIVMNAPAFPRTPAFHIDAGASSQFVTSLALAAARLVDMHGSAVDIVLDGPVASAGYLDLTLDWLRRAGYATVVEDRITIGPRSERPVRATIPGDWSSIAYLLLIAWRTQSIVTRVDMSAVHPDRAIVRILREIGLEVRDGRVTGTPARGVRASGKECPDLLPTLAALACVLPVPSILSDVDILRDKESDRLAGIENIAAAGGARAELDRSTLTIIPGPTPKSFSLSCRGDHRLAMSAATLAVLCGARMTLDDPRVVAKSFPRFWDELAKIGVTLSAS